MGLHACAPKAHPISIRAKGEVGGDGGPPEAPDALVQDAHLVVHLSDTQSTQYGVEGLLSYI